MVKLLFAVTAVLLAAGCQPSGPVPAATALQATGTLTPSPTFTIPSAVPTFTQTPGPTLTPTPDMLSDLGPLLFSDTFDRSSGWTLSSNETGAASLSNGSLNVVVSMPASSRTAAAPVNAPENFFLSVVSRPEICRPGDVFGLVVRYSSDLEHLRFLLDCDGAASVVSVKQGSRVTLVPQTETFAALPGPQAVNELSVRAQNNVFTFFVNNVEVLQVKETLLTGSGIGVIVRSDTGPLTTVKFDQIQLFSLPESAAVPATSSP